MSLLRPVSLIVSLMLALQTGCDFLCLRNDCAHASVKLSDQREMDCHGAQPEPKSEEKHHDDSGACTHQGPVTDGPGLSIKAFKAAILPADLLQNLSLSRKNEVFHAPAAVQSLFLPLQFCCPVLRI
jgi:hypothetical protein